MRDVPGGDLGPVDDEEVRSVGEASRDDAESGCGADSGGSCDDAYDEVCVRRRDARWRLCCTRAAFNLDSSALAASAAGGSVGRCIIEVWGALWSPGWGDVGIGVR